MRRPRFITALLPVLLCACAVAGPATPSPAPASSEPSALGAPMGFRAPTFMSSGAAMPPDSGWRTVYPGLEYRELSVMADHLPDRLRLARVDPARMRLTVRYDPNQPRSVGEWLSAEGALLAVNGGYFDPQNRALGLLIHDGVASGQPYQGFGGMFAVGGKGAQVRWNSAQPYEPGEDLTQAISNFPMLVLPGGLPNTGIDDNGQLSLRTAVGQDRQGRILFVVSPGGVFTLTGFSAWLAASDLDLDAALNLDGGSSSGLLVRDGAQSLGVDSWVGVPDVIVVNQR